MRTAKIFVNKQEVGIFTEIEYGRYVFTYYEGVDKKNAVSLTLPVNGAPEEWMAVHPVFQVFLPEGDNLEQIRKLARKVDVDDDFSLLCLLGKSLPGRIEIVNEETVNASVDEMLDLLFGENAKEGFNRAFKTAPLGALAISGALPKMLNSREKIGCAVENFIVKSGGEDYPYAALNEAVCLRLAEKCGFKIPDFRISEDGEVIAVKRFDVLEDGSRLGMEDIAALTARTRFNKFSGTEQHFADAITNFIPPANRLKANVEMFSRRIFDELIWNGDSHLKNTALIYTSEDDARLSPVYDVLCTKIYLPKDAPARAFNGVKEWLTNDDIVALGSVYGLSEKLALAQAQKIGKLFKANYNEVLKEVENEEIRERMEKLFNESILRLFPLWGPLEKIDFSRLGYKRADIKINRPATKLGGVNG